MRLMLELIIKKLNPIAANNMEWSMNWNGKMSFKYHVTAYKNKKIALVLALFYFKYPMYIKKFLKG